MTSRPQPTDEYPGDDVITEWRERKEHAEELRRDREEQKAKDEDNADDR